jgi:hypothetical protein
MINVIADYCRSSDYYVTTVKINASVTALSFLQLCKYSTIPHHHYYVTKTTMKIVLDDFLVDGHYY